MGHSNTTSNPTAPATKGGLVAPQAETSTNDATPGRTQNDLCQNGAAPAHLRPAGTDHNRTDGQRPEDRHQAEGGRCRDCRFWLPPVRIGGCAKIDPDSRTAEDHSCGRFEVRHQVPEGPPQFGGRNPPGHCRDCDDWHPVGDDQNGYCYAWTVRGIETPTTAGFGCGKFRPKVVPPEPAPLSRTDVIRLLAFIVVNIDAITGDQTVAIDFARRLRDDLDTDPAETWEAALTRVLTDPDAPQEIDPRDCPRCARLRHSLQLMAAHLDAILDEVAP